jgi:hypothetical protein
MYSQGQGITGTISDASGEPLPFATIYVRNIETGTTSNDEGKFELRLPAGKYDLLFQYLGYKSFMKYVEITSGMVKLEVQLESESIMLRDVEIVAGKEDPAYTIMRKAIAKAEYHTQQLDSYSTQVYIKGSGRLIDSPFFLRKMVAKEGVDSTTAFVSESISNLKYTRPDQYDEHVISIRSDGESNGTSPNGFVQGSFYESKIANGISPLSPRAFAYYKFQYLGTFRDREYEISKIRVVPRSRGDDVFEGEIFIVEELWSIHSLDLSTSYLGVEFDIKQIYNPIENKVWLPVSHQIGVHGTFFGFEFEYNYLAAMSQYQIDINKDLDIELTVIDENVEKELAAELQEQNKDLSMEALKKMDKGQEMTRKDFRKLMRAYEKMEEKQDSIPDVDYISNMTIDSTAYQNDSLFWNTARPVPLSDYEVRGYEKMDSMAVVERKEAEGDTIKSGKGKSGFQIQDIVMGGTYKVGDKAHFELKTPIINVNFNTVEGYNFYYEMNYTKTFENKHWLEIEPNVRFAFSENEVSGLLKTSYQFGSNNKRKTFVLTGGKYINQLNNEAPIVPVVNSITTLLLEGNFMKLYQKEFVELKFSNKISDRYRYTLSLGYQNRIPLNNTTDHTWIKYEDRAYTSNTPSNVESSNTEFQAHQAFLTSMHISMKPWIRYYIKNEERRQVNNASPEFTLHYENAIPMGGAEIAFHRLSADMTHAVDIGIRGKFSFRVGGGGLLAKDSISFLDFNHFQGNRTPYQDIDVVKSYRLLPYYELSTSGAYFNLLTHYQFRKLFLSRFKFMRKRGIKESVFANYLGTASSNHYSELGYSIDNIFRLFRLEGVASFQDGQYVDWGIRFGIAAFLEDMFNFD